MGSYTILTLAAMGGVVALELAVLRTGVFRRPEYWIALTICLAFQVLVDGWLTKLSSPVVLYDDGNFSGIRIFFDSPIEDFGFGFALITLAVMSWIRAGRDEAAADDDRG
jgi:lycopene cyclase domain-containing protein